MRSSTTALHDLLRARTSTPGDDDDLLPRPRSPAFPDNKYKGRKIIVIGVVDRVTKAFGEVSVLIKPQGAKRFSIDRVAYKVSDDDMDMAASTRPGDPIRAHGCVTGMLGNVFVEPCDD